MALELKIFNSPREQDSDATNSSTVCNLNWTLAEAVRQNAQIKGISIEGREHDSLFAVQFTTSIYAVEETSPRCGHISGLSINWSKTDIFP